MISTICLFVLFLLRISAVGNPLFNNLVTFQSKETHTCSICLELFNQNEILFAVHPQLTSNVGKSDIYEESSYPKMHLLHISCLSAHYSHLNSDCPVCKEKIQFLAHLDENFLVSIFHLSSIRTFYPVKIPISLVKNIITWMAEAVDNPNEIQKFILKTEIREGEDGDDEVSEGEVHEGLFDDIFSQLKLSIPNSNYKRLQFRKLLVIKREEILNLIQLTDKNYRELSKDESFR